VIVFVYGTSAEAIKLAPLARRFESQGVKYEQWLTMFHGTSLQQSVRRLGFTDGQEVIPNGNGGETIRSPWQTLRWIFACLGWILANRRKLKKRIGKNSVLIVHGDTITTVLGATFAKILGLPSAHVEAGLRSGNWRHPFPEELDRIIAGALVSIHYAPSEESVKNLDGKKDVVYTHGNTVIDAVLDVDEDKNQAEEKFGVCLLHRFEFLGNPELVRKTLEIIVNNTKIPVRLYLDDYAGGILGSVLGKISSDKLQAQRKLPYDQFILALRKAEFVFTDSGGIQAECALLGTPTLIHRKATEQHEGVGKNILLSNWDLSVAERFLESYQNYRRPIKRPEISPAEIIVADLVERGFTDKISGS
jgi:UDP-N-acetylglucosamine 2-epimerase (non-hydrolysing)